MSASDNFEKRSVHAQTSSRLLPRANPNEDPDAQLRQNDAFSDIDGPEQDLGRQDQKGENDGRSRPHSTSGSEREQRSNHAVPHLPPPYSGAPSSGLGDGLMDTDPRNPFTAVGQSMSTVVGGPIAGATAVMAGCVKGFTALPRFCFDMFAAAGSCVGYCLSGTGALMSGAGSCMAGNYKYVGDHDDHEDRRHAEDLEDSGNLEGDLDARSRDDHSVIGEKRGSSSRAEQRSSKGRKARDPDNCGTCARVKQCGYIKPKPELSTFTIAKRVWSGPVFRADFDIYGADTSKVIFEIVTKMGYGHHASLIEAQRNLLIGSAESKRGFREREWRSEFNWIDRDLGVNYLHNANLTKQSWWPMSPRYTIRHRAPLHTGYQVIQMHGDISQERFEFRLHDPDSKLAVLTLDKSNSFFGPKRWILNILDARIPAELYFLAVAVMDRRYFF